MVSRLSVDVPIPAFELLEPRVLLSATGDPKDILASVQAAAPAASVTKIALATESPVSGITTGGEDYKQWSWSGSMDIPDGPSGSWVGVDCLTPGSIPSGSSVTHVSLHYEITHPYVYDLQIELDNATHSWAVRTNEYSSQPNLNETRTNAYSFIGDTPAQDWYFWVCDTLANDVGTLTAMQLTVYYAPGPDTPPQISGIPGIAITENSTYPSSSGSTGSTAPAQADALKLGFDGDTSQFVTGSGAPLGDATPQGASFRTFDQFGGTWWDCEKTLSNHQDDLMCWAAAASNMLEWTGWGQASGLTTSQDIFQYFQNHWTDQGGMMRYGWEWWFSGNNPTQGWYGWSQVDVAGGGFYPTQNFASYFYDNETDSGAMSAIDQYCRAGDGVTLGIYGPGGHAITCWGFNYDPNNPTHYYGVWITDSDDDKNTDSPTPALRYYEVAQSNGAWYLQNYYGSNSWYIGSVQALDRNPGNQPPPPPPTPNGLDLQQYASDAETSVDQLTFSIVGNSNPACGVTLVSGRYIQINPTHNWYGYSDVTVQVSDGQLVGYDTFRVTVSHVNQPPTLSGIPDKSLVKNQSLPYAIVLPSFASDPETSSYALTYQIVGNTNPSCGASIASRYYVSINPAAGWTGSSDVTVQVSDGSLTATDVFHVTVADTSVDLAGALTPVILPNPTKGNDYHLVQLAVTNSGNALASGFSTMELWASAAGNDYKLAEIRPYLYLPAGATGYYYFSYLAPTNIPAGTYSLVGIVDSHNDIAESNETNNATSIAGRVVMQNPDLTVGFVWVAAPAAPNKGAYAVALLQVNNIGTTMAVAPIDIQVWASPDGNIHNSSGEYLLTTLHNYWVVLPGGTSTYFAAVFQLPVNMTSGSYQFAAVVDSSSNVAETNETNNETYTASSLPVGQALGAVVSSPVGSQGGPAASAIVAATPALVADVPIASAQATPAIVPAVHSSASVFASAPAAPVVVMDVATPAPAPTRSSDFSHPSQWTVARTDSEWPDLNSWTNL